MILFGEDIKEVIKLTQENEEFKRGIDEILSLIANRNDPDLHIIINNKDEKMRYIIDKVYDIILENKSLKMK
jgi:hypothetical protein